MWFFIRRGVKFAVIAHCGFVAGPISLLWFLVVRVVGLWLRLRSI